MSTLSPGNTVLRNFYGLRALVAFLWVAVVVLTRSSPLIGAVLLVIYAAWDALANYLDAQRNGGLSANPGQRMNLGVSAAMSVLLAVGFVWGGPAGAVGVFGVWALLAGLFQLIVGIRRRKQGGQVFMMISGAQSALAGGAFLFRAFSTTPHISDLAPYAAFGGFYFLLSALWLSFRRQPQVVAH
ncbi:hypothetical protein [Dyella sp.]|uniref:hypothetical protein n=1 Tax=Dyella sp. TaxID=1869338 RepID=UPI002ED209C5